MTKCEFTSLKEGDKVRIVSEWPEDNSAYENDQGLMDCWLGKIMTIDYAPRGGDSFASCVEDAGRWGWNRFAIDCILPAVEPVGIEVLI